MALVCCILGKFLGVVCQCFLPYLDIPTFTTRCLHIRHDARDPGGGRWNCGRECCPVIIAKLRLPRHIGIFYMPQIYDMGPTALLPLQRKACWGFFFALKNPTALAGFEPVNFGTKGQHATPRSLKYSCFILIHVPCIFYYCLLYPTNKQLYQKYIYHNNVDYTKRCKKLLYILL